MRDLPGGTRRATRAVRGRRVHQAGRGRARGASGTTSWSTRRAEAEFRRDRGTRPGRPQPSRCAPPTMRRRPPPPRPSWWSGCARRAQALPGRHRPRGVHLPGRGLRVHRQPGVRAAGARRARPGGHHLDLERVRAGRLRHGRNAHPSRAAIVTPSKIFTESLFAERGILDHAGARPEGGPRASATTRRWRARQREAGFDFAMLLPPFSGVGLSARDRDGATSRRRSSCPTGSCAWTRTIRPEAVRRLVGAGLAPHLSVAASTTTCSRAGSPSRPRTRSPGPGRRPAARPSRPRRPAPACPRR